MLVDDDLETLRYPIGRFRPRQGLSREEIDGLIEDIAALPGDFRRVAAPLTREQLDTPYRPGGWTVRQVIHHVPDSHVNAYIRFKLALTEDQPTIKPYDEAAWAELPDGRGEDIEGSLLLLEATHRRWTHVLRSLDTGAWARAFHHPDSGVVSLEHALQLYAWHGRHHLAHVTRLRERSGW
ncbi:MAG TPA: bacillithiol transferase BstA [Longimicrobiales bacterium]|nr:bacillithiol transferase BstA [Longimicrobiales bacterium]